MTLSDLTSKSDRLSIDSHALQGIRPPLFVPSTSWPTQPSMTSAQQKLWKNYITSTFLRYGTKWKNCPTDRPPATSTPCTTEPTQYNSLQEYLISLPVWQQRLFCQFEQVADDPNDMESVSIQTLA